MNLRNYYISFQGEFKEPYRGVSTFLQFLLMFGIL